jgi:hypothetical protein
MPSPTTEWGRHADSEAVQDCKGSACVLAPTCIVGDRKIGHWRLLVAEGVVDAIVQNVPGTGRIFVLDSNRSFSTGITQDIDRRAFCLAQHSDSTVPNEVSPHRQPSTIWGNEKYTSIIDISLSSYTYIVMWAHWHLYFRYRLFIYTLYVVIILLYWTAETAHPSVHFGRTGAQFRPPKT